MKIGTMVEYSDVKFLVVAMQPDVEKMMKNGIITTLVIPLLEILRLFVVLPEEIRILARIQ